MARILFTTAICIVMINLMAGCEQPPKQSYLMAPMTEGAVKFDAPISGALEVELAEKLVTSREIYHQDLAALAGYYKQAGNFAKYEWAQKELEALKKIPNYRYLIDAEVAGPNLKAIESIPSADLLYQEAMQDFNKGRVGVIPDEKTLRIALDKFNRIIRLYPTSDKIDDAAYRAGEIYEIFRDYDIAQLYYKRAFQWDENTPYPARFKAAYIIDRIMHQRLEALDLYKQSVEKETKPGNYIEYAKQRIEYLSSPKSTPEGEPVPPPVKGGEYKGSRY